MSLQTKEYKLDNLKKEEKGSFVSGPFGSNISSKFFVESGVPVIRGNNLTKGSEKFIDKDYVFITNQKAIELKNCEAIPDDIIFTAAGTLGQIGIIPKKLQFKKYIISNKQIRFRCNTKIVDPLFLYYYLINPSMRDLIESQNKGSSIPLLTLGSLKWLPILLPDINEQKKISSFLDKIDFLIENNLKKISLLDEVTRITYEEWFLRFKIDGKKQKFDKNSKIPFGWSLRPFSELVDFLEGPGLRNWQYKDEGIPFLNIRLIKEGDISFKDIKYLDKNEVAKKYKHFLLQENDHVLSSSGTLGRLTTIRKYHLPLCLNTSIIRMRKKNDHFGTWLIKHTLEGQIFQNLMDIYANGSAQVNFGPTHLNKIKIIAPPKEIALQYEKIMEPIEEKMKLLRDQNNLLKELKLIILPRVISGKINISKLINK